MLVTEGVLYSLLSGLADFRGCWHKSPPFVLTNVNTVSEDFSLEGPTCLGQESEAQPGLAPVLLSFRLKLFLCLPIKLSWLSEALVECLRIYNALGIPWWTRKQLCPSGRSEAKGRHDSLTCHYTAVSLMLWSPTCALVAHRTRFGQARKEEERHSKPSHGELVKAERCSLGVCCVPCAVLDQQRPLFLLQGSCNLAAERLSCIGRT